MKNTQCGFQFKRNQTIQIAKAIAVAVAIDIVYGVNPMPNRVLR